MKGSFIRNIDKVAICINSMYYLSILTQLAYSFAQKTVSSISLIERQVEKVSIIIIERQVGKVAKRKLANKQQQSWMRPGATILSLKVILLLPIQHIRSQRLSY